MLDLTWRFAVTTLTGRIVTLLDRRSTARKVLYTFNKAATATGNAPADVPEINLVLGDGHTFLDEGTRNVYGFRKEGGATEWTVRFGGRILTIQDQGDAASGTNTSTWTAYDPRQLLYFRPCLTAGGTLPGPNGLHFTGMGAAEIALTLLQRTIDFHGEVGIDPTGGTVETTDNVDFHFEQITSVGEAWDQLNAAGECDIILTAAYDPADRPGTLCDLNIYARADGIKRHAIFSWDQPGHSVVAIDRLVDGTQRINKAAYLAGQGGPRANTVSDAASIVEYGQYWAQRAFPAQNVKGAAEALAHETVLFQKNGVTTYEISPAPAQASIQTPVLFIDYFLGNQVPLYASSRLRRATSGLHRVYQIPVELRDDGTETISRMTFSADGLGGIDAGEVPDDVPGPDAGGGGGGGSGGGNPILGGSLYALMPESSGTSNIYVSPSGSDGGAGTEGDPYKTIGKAFSVASSGAFIFARSGDYPTVYLLSKRYDENDPVTLETHPDDLALGNYARFVGQASYTNAFELDNCKGIRLRNLKHDAPYNTDLKIDTCQWISVDNPYVLNAGRSQYGLVYGPQGIIVVENVVGGYAHTYCEHISIVNPRITNCGGQGASSNAHDHPIYFSGGQTSQILNAYIHDNPCGYGIQMGPNARGLIVANPTIVRHTSTSPYAGDGIVMWNGEPASDPKPGTTDCLVVNGIIAHCDSYAVTSSNSQSAPSNVVRDTLSFDNDSGDFNTLYGSLTGYTLVAPNYTGTDPLFVSSSDLRLQAGSPALAIADPDYCPGFDWFGNDRPDNPALGAFEVGP